ncbi:MAG: hypothetical protein AAF399_29090, partial [Bacteroidota bacterium]
MNTPSLSVNKGENDKLDIKAFLFKLVDHWYYFAVSIGIFVVLALFYIKRTAPTFAVNATMLISQPTEADMPGDAIMGNMRKFHATQSLENEIEILTSHQLIRNVIGDLNMEVGYYEDGTFRPVELYQSLPFEVVLDTSEFQLVNAQFYLEFLSSDRYKIKVETDFIQTVRLEDDATKSYEDRPFDYEGEGVVGKPFSTDYFNFTINKTDLKADLKKLAGRKLFFLIKKPTSLADKYRNKLNVTTTGEESSVINISLEGAVPKKEVDFLRSLCDSYIDRRLIEKNYLASKTIEFIQEQLDMVSDSLKDAENALSRIQSSQATFDPTSIATEANQRLMNLQAELANAGKQQQYLTSVLGDLTAGSGMNEIVVPSFVGIDDPLLNSSVGELKTLYSEKVGKEALGQKIEVEIIDRKIADITTRITQNVRGLIRSIDLDIESKEAQIAGLQSTIRRLPRSSQNMNKALRNIEITDNHYNYLVQKLTEAGITRTANTADSRVLDPARRIGAGPVGPNKGLILAVSILFGILIPVLVIYAKDMFDDTIKSQNQIEEMTGVPVLGTIAHNSEDEELYELNNLTSQVVESFRYLKVNLQFVGTDSPKKIISVTSTIPQEGKTFCAFNLASVTAVSGSKVVVIGADIRKPALHKAAGLENKLGLTNFLINQASVEQIVQKTHLKDLDVITSGPIPPNPTDLLNKPRFKQ